MSPPLRIGAWVVALAASAGIGAFVAAHTNPLQPGLEGSAPSAVPSASASPAGADRWRGTMVSHSEHELHVGGTCVSNWKIVVSFEIGAEGRVSGEGEAGRTTAGDPCPFPTAQPQIERYVLDVGGGRRGDTLVLVLTETAHRPDAATDLGGFGATALSEPLRLTVTGNGVRERIVQTSPDGKAGTYRAVTLVQLACRNC